MGDQSIKIELPLRDEIQERGHVAIRGPAHVADRIVPAALRVVRIVHAGAHRPAETEVDFLAEPGPPVELDLGVADAHDAAAIPYQPGGQLDRLVAPGRGGDQHRVHARSRADPERQRERLLAVRTAGAFGARMDRELALRRLEIDPHHPASVRARELDQELAEQAEADDGDALAELEAGLA